MAIKLSELAKKLDCLFQGEDCLINNVADINHAENGDLVFISNLKYRRFLSSTLASAVVSQADWLEGCTLPALIADNPRLTFAKAAALLNPVTASNGGIHPSAVIAENASVDDTATIDANAVVKSGASIAAHSYIGAGTVIGENVNIGKNSYLNANVTIYADCEIGSNCIIHSAVVIGADGFGFVKDQDAYFKVPQLGRVRIGDDVEIGASTTIDRGALLDTVIGNGVKLDNQIQIGHNVEIGDHTVISACSCVAGTVKIGKFCLFGGSVGVRDNIEICDNVIITGRTLVSHSITKPGSYSSSTPMDETTNWRKNAARFRKLDEMARRLSKLEKNDSADSDS
ncbi:MAG: UDP-3-O-(3-hydroxymyristoyl)glucosamine N-acyltransferase [Gammaproteobacteria bacterium]|nr:UDP-3-O-(3-hydroxymyristoyl)glucosamine N-acyltransferase [Gammaproteobacteria bacterium]